MRLDGQGVASTWIETNVRLGLAGERGRTRRSRQGPGRARAVVLAHKFAAMSSAVPPIGLSSLAEAGGVAANMAMMKIKRAAPACQPLASALVSVVLRQLLGPVPWQMMPLFFH